MNKEKDFTETEKKYLDYGLGKIIKSVREGKIISSVQVDGFTWMWGHCVDTHYKYLSTIV